MWISYVLAISLAVVMWLWARNTKNSRTVLWIMLWDMALFAGVIAWFRAARDYWPQWALTVTWILWFCVGVGAIAWTVLAMELAKDGNLPPPSKPKEPPMGSANFVQPTVYGSRARAKYVMKGKRARR